MINEKKPRRPQNFAAKLDVCAVPLCLIRNNKYIFLAAAFFCITLFNIYAHSEFFSVGFWGAGMIPLDNAKNTQFQSLSIDADLGLRYGSSAFSLSSDATLGIGWNCIPKSRFALPLTLSSGIVFKNLFFARLGFKFDPFEYGFLNFKEYSSITDFAFFESGLRFSIRGTKRKRFIKICFGS